MPEPSPSTPTDLDLVNRFRRFNDRPAFDRLVERHQGWVRGLCARMLRSDEQAKDAAQEVFTRALAHLDHWRGDNFPGWLKAIAVNCVLTIVDREKRWAPFEPSQDLPSSARNPEQLILSEETSVRARAVITRLPEKQRIVFVMKHIDGYSYDDIARLTGFTGKEVKSFLQNARRNFSLWWTDG